jgi:hypothetical protein
MTLKIPVYQRQTVAEGRVGAAPSIVAAPRAAFGEQALLAGADLGRQVARTGTLLGKHIQEMQERENKRQVLDMDTNMRKELQGELRSNERDENGKIAGLLNRELGDASGATVEFDGRFGKLEEKYLNNAKNQQQRDLLTPMLSNAYKSARASVINHEAGQLNAADRKSLEDFKTQREADASAYTSAEQINEAISQATAIYGPGLRRHGIDPAVGNANISYNIVNNAVSTMLERDTAQARAMFEKTKGSLTAKDRESVELKIQGKELLDEQQAAWEQLSVFRLSDGSADLGTMKSKIDGAVANKQINQDKANKIWSYVRSRAQEQGAIKLDRDNAQDTSFMNAISTAKANGESMNQAMRFVGVFGRQANDKRLKSEIIKTIWTKEKIVRDDALYMTMWRDIDAGALNTTQDQINKAFYIDKKLPVSDWESLSKKLYSEKSGNDKLPQDKKDAIKKLGILADQKLEDKVQRDQFIYLQTQKADTLTADQLWKEGNDQLETDPETKWFFHKFGGVKGFEKEWERADIDSTNKAVLENALGARNVTAIGMTIAEDQGKETYNLEDINNFFNELNLDVTTGDVKRVRNAINSLINHDKKVTPEAVRVLLMRRPDGIW